MDGRDVPGLSSLGSKCPKTIWYWGKWNPSLFDNTATVVGSRRMTQYGQRVVERLVVQLAGEGRTIVSGLMYGVDMWAHRNCLACGGKTIAVVGWGINWPGVGSEEIRLMKQIVDGGGLVLSEWDVWPPEAWTFPMRDRLMAALGKELYVVEAGLKSGSLITADWARKLGRTLWAVPGPVTSSVSAGTNKLISDGLARIWTPGSGEMATKLRYTKNADIYTALQNDTFTADELARILNKSIEVVIADLTMMVISGEVEEKEGRFYLKR